MTQHETVMTDAQRLEAYDRLRRVLIPGWKVEFAKSLQSMRKATPAASDPNGSLRDLATFIIAARANENAQISLLAAEKLAREMHPMSNAKFGT